jgi:hypothetical protein
MSVQVTQYHQLHNGNHRVFMKSPMKEVFIDLDKDLNLIDTSIKKESDLFRKAKSKAVDYVKETTNA